MDYIFIPQIVSIREKTYGCPQVLGAPLVAKVFPCENMPEILSVSIDYNGRLQTIFSVLRLAIKLSKNPVKIFKAVYHFITVTSKQDKIENDCDTKKSNTKKIAIIARKYTLADDFLNVRLEKRIKDDFGYDVITSSQILQPATSKPTFGCRPVHWYEGQDLVNAANHFMLSNSRSALKFFYFRVLLKMVLYFCKKSYFNPIFII